jgi:hypothetical protein
MTDDKKPMFEHVMWMQGQIEAMVHEGHPGFEMHWQVACIMRRAAGLPYSDTPVAGWREDGTPELFSIVYGIVSAASGPVWDYPKLVMNELLNLRHSLRDLKQKLLSIDEQAMELINEYADPIMQQHVDKLNNEFTIKEIISEFSEFQEKVDSEHHQTPIEATLEQMDRLEEGLTRTLEWDLEEDAQNREDMGQLRTYAAKQVALGVANYMYMANDKKIPGFWTGQNPSGPYPTAVLEIFDLLGIPRGSFQQAAPWAIEKLKNSHTAKLESDS